MSKKLPLIALSLLSVLTMSACWKDFLAIAKEARDIAIGVVMTDLPGPPKVPVIDPAKLRRREASKRCTQLIELEKKAVLIFVDKNAGQTRDGKGWKTAYRSVAQGVKMAFVKRAEASNQGKKIYVLVAGGTYNFDHEDFELNAAGLGGLVGNGPILGFDLLGQSDRMRDIEVIGGYASNDLCLEDDVNKILNEGKNNQRLTTIDGQNQSNNVVFFSGDARAKNLALRHFTIKGGNALVGIPAPAMGGAIFVMSYAVNGISDITLEDLTVEGQSNGDGGCIALREAKNITLEKVKFTNCVAAQHGGGLAITGAGTDAIKVNNCSFARTNTAGMYGGGAAIFGTGRPEPLVPMPSPDIFTGALRPRVHFFKTTISGGIANLGGGLGLFGDVERIKFEGGSISDNAAGLGSGISLVDRVNFVEFKDVAIERNRNGGGIYMLTDIKRISFNNSSIRGHHNLFDGGGMRADDVEGLWLKSLTFEGNTSAQNGGGIHLDGGTNIHIEGTKFLNNRATNGDGGGMRGIGLDDVIINNCEFSDNTASQDGGGISLSDCDDVDVRGSTFSHNTATRDGGNAYISDLVNQLTVLNSTIDRGSAGRNAGGLYVQGFGAGLRKLELDGSTFSNNEINGGGVCDGAAGVYGRDLGFVELKTSHFYDNVVRNPALGSNCAGAMKLFNLQAQPNALIVDSTAGKLNVKRNKVIGADPVDVNASHIHGAIMIPQAVHTGVNYTTNPVVLNAINNKPFNVEANTPIREILKQPALGIAGGGIPVNVYGEDNREIVVSMYD